MSNDTGFAERRAEVGRLIDNRHRLKDAHREAERLIRDYPDRAEAYYLLNLIICLANYNGGGGGTQHLIERVRSCPDYTVTLEGDMQRDRAIGIMRYSRRAADLSHAAQLIDAAQKCHAGDTNREACLTGIVGRLTFAKGSYRRAIELHAEADRMWSQIGHKADAMWVYFNLIQWLRATIADSGRRSAQARNLVERIRTEVPKGERTRINEARMLTAPGGLKAYRLAELLRG